MKTKDLFTMMREEEIATSNFLPSKKEITSHSQLFAKKILDNGDVTKEELLSQVVRLQHALTTILDTIKDDLQVDGFNAYGLQVSYVQGRKIEDYKSDDVCAELTKKLNDRKKLVKLATNSDDVIYDSDGVEVSKVPISYGKSYFKIVF